MESDKPVYPEEMYANELYKRLQEESFVAELKAKLTISGLGVHWHCTISKDKVSSEIYCFDEGAYGVQYLTFFKSGDESKAVARTNSIEETVASISTWLPSSDVEILYAKHPFVDETKRNLTSLHQVILGLDPTLAEETEHQLTSSGDDFHELSFSHGNRSCIVSAADHFQNHLLSFKEDQVEIFSCREKKPDSIVQALSCWLMERLSPTMLGRSFEGLIFSEVAIYYEIGRPVIGEFIQSWNSVERFFLNTRTLESAQAYVLLTKLRAAGYDTTLRAGQSLLTLILSRSRRHGLRKGQPCIHLDVYNNEVNVHCSFPEEEVHELKFPYYSSKEPPFELISLLDKLVALPIT